MLKYHAKVFFWLADIFIKNGLLHRGPLFFVCRSVESWISLEVSYCDALRKLVSFVQFKKRKRYPWRSVPEASNFTKSNAPPWVFFTFFKLFELYQIAQCTISLVYYGVFEFVPLPTPILYYDFFTILVFRKFGAGERFQITSETKLFPLLVCFTLLLVQYYGQKNWREWL